LTHSIYPYNCVQHNGDGLLKNNVAQIPKLYSINGTRLKKYDYRSLGEEQ